MIGEDPLWCLAAIGLTIDVMPEHPHTHYLPGMGHDRLIALYDPLTWLLRIRRAHLRVLDRAGIRPGDRVLEVGCGTGNLALLVKRELPNAEVRGIDPDPLALARAARRARRRGLDVRFDRGFAEAMPYEDEAFDHVLSAFMLHHLDEPVQARMLEEARRVLRPGGTLTVVDFGGAGAPARGRLATIVGDRVPALMRDAGFGRAAQVERRTTVLGPQAIWSGA